jgi:hypothetical protein
MSLFHNKLKVIMLGNIIGGSNQDAHLRTNLHTQQTFISKKNLVNW